MELAHIQRPAQHRGRRVARLRRTITAQRQRELAATIAALRERGLQPSDAMEGGRARPDGTQLRWRSASFWQAGRELPFLIEDVTPRALRVPEGAATQHRNGATGIQQLTIAVADLDRLRAQWAALSDDAPMTDDADRRLDAAIVSFALDAQRIRLAEPGNIHSPVQQQIEAIGLGPFEVTLSKLNRRAVMPLDPQGTQGVRILL